MPLRKPRITPQRPLSASVSVPSGWGAPVSVDGKRVGKFVSPGYTGQTSFSSDPKQATGPIVIDGKKVAKQISSSYDGPRNFSSNPKSDMFPNHPKPPPESASWLNTLGNLLNEKWEDTFGDVGVLPPLNIPNPQQITGDDSGVAEIPLGNTTPGPGQVEVNGVVGTPRLGQRNLLALLNAPIATLPPTQTVQNPSFSSNYGSGGFGSNYGGGGGGSGGSYNPWADYLARLDLYSWNIN